MVRSAGGWSFGVWLGTAILAGGLAGCDAKSDAGADKPCSKDRDCSDEQECLLTSSTQQPIPFNPCITILPCTDDSSCGSGMVCGPYVAPNSSFPSSLCPPKTCIASCKTAGCATGGVCADNGVCRPLKCDEPDGPACAAHYRCDSAEALSRPAMALSGSSVADPDGAERQAQIGCVRKLCDEPDGFVCREPSWACDPANAPTEASGCVPLPCTETGKCWDDGYSICAPENDGPRPSGTDMHGCVVRNCGEGYQCQQIRDSINYADCALDSPDADPWGCVVRNCEELPELCGDGRICDRAARLNDVFGCRALDCRDAGGPACVSGSTCQLVSAETGYHSCVSDGAGGGNGGSGGNGGNEGSGGARVNPPAGGASGAGSGGAVTLTGGRSSTGGASNGVTGGTTVAQPTVSGICVARE